MSKQNDSFFKTVFVALAVCLVCSIVVSFAAVQLKPQQKINKLLDKQTNILAVAGFDVKGKSGKQIAEMFEQNIETRVIELATGEYTDAVNPLTYDQRKAAKDPAMSEAMEAEADIASIRRQANYAPVYVVKEGDGIKCYILPIHGYGLWSTLYGFLAVEPDANTVYGLSFYEHAETPGLGGEVDNPKWKAQWPGKQLFANGEVAIQVVKNGQYNPDADNAVNTVDGLAGASLTTRGVHNLVAFWVSEAGFGPFLNKLKKS